MVTPRPGTAPDPCPVDPLNDSGWACRDTARCARPCPVPGEDPADGAGRPEPMPDLSDEERRVWLDLIEAAMTFGMGAWVEHVAGERDSSEELPEAPAVEFLEAYLPIRTLIRDGSDRLARIRRAVDDLHEEEQASTLLADARWRAGVHHAEHRIREVLDAQ